MLKGILASPGIVFGKTLVLKESEIVLNKQNITESQIEQEKNKFLLAREQTASQLKNIKDIAIKNLGEDKAEIFEGHLLLLEDEELENDIFDLIESELLTADNATNNIIQKQYKLLSSLEDEYLRERAGDIKDIGDRIVRNILGLEIIDLSAINEEIILVSHDLTPSQTAQLPLDKVLGFITDIGGRTSHTSIMARSLEIPAIVGTNNITQLVKSGDFLILNAINNNIIINPTKDEVNNYIVESDKYKKEQEELHKLVNLPAVTLDGHQIELASNIGTVADVNGTIKHGAQGIGLYRSEFLFMDRDNFPSEEEQFIAYKTVCEKMEGKLVIVRTMDIGGDKDLPYLQLPKELNPFLGYRAIRIGFDKKDSLKTQLKAILRASNYGNIGVMFPMVISLNEIKVLKEILEECKKELSSSKIKFNNDIKVGVMIETPAAAIVADLLIKELDFFSIGTNDLTQYVLAVDRGNEMISYLYDPYNPAVLRLIKSVIDSSHKNNKWTGMCGELAGDDLATALLIGLGLDEFSMSSISISKVKRIIRNVKYNECKDLAEKALNLSSGDEIRELLTKFYKAKGLL